MKVSNQSVFQVSQPTSILDKYTDCKKIIEIWAKTLKRDIVALYLASRHADCPISAKIIASSVVAYAVSPIDLIPDFIPVLGYLDDAIILPVGIALTLKLIPEDLMRECRKKAEEMGRIQANWIAAAVVVAVWSGLAFGLYQKIG